jgi:hypothetical protein
LEVGEASEEVGFDVDEGAEFDTDHYSLDELVIEDDEEVLYCDSD